MAPGPSRLRLIRFRTRARRTSTMWRISARCPAHMSGTECGCSGEGAHPRCTELCASSQTLECKCVGMFRRTECVLRWHGPCSLSRSAALLLAACTWAGSIHLSGLIPPCTVLCRWFSGNLPAGLATASSCKYTLGDPVISVLSSPKESGGPYTCALSLPAGHAVCWFTRLHSDAVLLLQQAPNAPPA